MKLIDRNIRKYSSRVFEGLKEDDYRILKHIAKSEPKNLSQLGQELTDSYAYETNRWAITTRLYESQKSLGLITNEYLYKISINKKEYHYGLTLKGLLSVLAKLKFDNLWVVKRFQKFLLDIINDKKLVRWALDFIKNEIVLILAYNYYKGIGWTRFRFLQLYFDKFKKYDKDFMYELFLDTSWNLNAPDYKEIKDEYLKLYFILEFLTHPIKFKHYSEYYYQKAKDKNESFRRFVDGWYRYISLYQLNDRPTEFDESRKDLKGLYNFVFKKHDWIDTIDLPWIYAQTEIEKAGKEKRGSKISDYYI